MNRTNFRLKTGFAAGLFGAAFCLAPVHAGPEGAVQVYGTVSIAQFGDFFFISPSDGAVVSYTSFNLTLNETVQFLQGSPNATVLNVIPSGGPTTIQGKIFADGIVFFANPSGFVFGPNSVVDANGFYAAAASIDDTQMQNFHQGNDFSFHVPNSGAVISISDGASITGASGVGLIGRQIFNHGHVSVSGTDATLYMAALSNGDVVLSAGSYLVSMPAVQAAGDPFDGPGVTNTGSITAQGDGSKIQLGASDLYGLAIRMEGNGIKGAQVEAHGSVELGSDVTIEATEKVTFYSTINSSGDGDVISDANALTIDAATAEVVFHEAIGGNADGALGSIDVTGDTIVVTDVTTSGDQTFDATGGVTLGSTYTGDNFTIIGDTTLDNNVTVNMTGHAEFHGKIDGPGMDLTVMTGDTAFFLNDIGSAGALGDFEVKVGNVGNNAALADAGSVIEFGELGGGLFTLDADSVSLNEFGSGIAHTGFATIASPNALTINTNQFTMGIGQKMTVLGDLNLNVAAPGTAVLGDLNTIGNMNVNALGGIVLQLRPAGGGDLGLDFVSTNTFNFTGPISTIGAGSPPIFANPTGTGIAGHVKFVYSPTTPPASPNNFVAMSGQLLDLSAALGTPVDDPSGDTGGGGGNGPGGGGDPEGPPELDPGSVQDLEDMIELRDLTDEERLAMTEGRGLFVDGEPSEVLPEGAVSRYRISSRRLNAQAVRLFKQQEEVLYDRFDEYVDSLEDAWTIYSDEFADIVSPDGFANFLSEREALNEALEGLRNIAGYVQAMEAMGMSPREARDEAWDTVYEDFLPQGMTKEQFEQAVRNVRTRQVALR